MYLRLVRFTLLEGSRSRAQATAADLIPAIKQQPGCMSAIFFGGGEDGESGICVLWDSQEHADAAAAVIGPKLEQHLAGNVSGQPDRRLFPVIAS
jgi:quinol monooxygenase YgiN